MPPSASKIAFNPTELAQLEHAFATDPTSDAYRPLAEAYLSIGRYMEAMVVCKKGVKAHASTPDARVLLARVYAEQGKDKKALEELQGALQVAPDNLTALRMTGALLCKTGDGAAGAEHLKKALAKGPDDPDTLDQFKRYGIAVPEPEPVAPPPPVVPAPPPSAAPAAPASAAPEAPPVLEATAPAASTAAPASPVTPQTPAPRASPHPPATRAVPAQLPVPPVSYDDLAARYGEGATPRTNRGGRLGLALLAGVIVVGFIGLVFYRAHRKADAEHRRTVDRLLRLMREELAHDSYAGYKKACDYGEQIVSDLKIDEDMLLGAHSYLAYAYAIRWTEHGEGELVEKSATEHLARAKGFHKEHSHIVAAEAYIQFYGGRPQEAESDLEQIVEKKGKGSALLLSTLGIIQMHAGDLDKAFANLKLAQALAPADPRINAALGNVLRRQGDDFKAANAFETALRNERDHAEAQLGVALMAIDAGKLETADKYVKRLLAADPPPSNRQLALARVAHSIVLDEQNQGAEADKEQALAFEADARNGELYVLKSRRLMRGGRGDEAVAAIREAIKLDPRRASFYVDLAKALTARPGGAKEALESLKQALRTMPGTPRLLVLLGNAYAAAEQLDRAKESYEKALAAAKDKLPEARMSLADLARTRRDWTGALELYKKAVEEYLASPERKAYALTEIGRIQEEQFGDRKDALDRYKAATAADPTYAPPVFLVARMFQNDRDKKKREIASTFLQKYLEMAPKGEFAAEASRLLAERR
jgi:tetratricopeptide (TPR) repeat protein